MYEQILADAVFSRMLSHFKESKMLTLDEFIQINTEENRRSLINDVGKELYGELEIEPAGLELV